MLWLRGVIFSLLAPGIVAGVVPHWLRNGRSLAQGWWQLGWLPVIAGSAGYALCLVTFLISGGTPAMFITRPLRLLVGEEPPAVVTRALYRHTRNPMYLSVLTVIAGQAMIFRSVAIAVYAALAAAFFHLAVVFLEEPHLARVRGQEYTEYRRQVSRWIGPPKR